MRIQIALALAACSASVSAAPATCGDLATSYNEDNSVRSVARCDERCRSAPTWDGKSGEPPLSIGEAMSAAREWGRKKLGSEVDVSEISLMPYYCGDTKHWDYWVYVNLADSSRITEFAVVLMDGSIVESRPVARKPTGPKPPETFFPPTGW